MGEGCGWDAKWVGHHLNDKVDEWELIRGKRGVKQCLIEEYKGGLILVGKETAPFTK